jgi:hypothetical protein
MLKTLMHLAKGPEFKPQYHKKKKNPKSSDETSNVPQHNKGYI